MMVLIDVVIGVCMLGSMFGVIVYDVVLYYCGISFVNVKFDMLMRISGRIVSVGWGSVFVLMCFGLLMSDVL